MSAVNAKEVLDMKIEKRVHRVWEKMSRIQMRSQILGKWQYIYSSEKGEISLVKFMNYFREGDKFWEIYCLEGKLFEDCERFDTKKDAEKRIKELLEMI